MRSGQLSATSRTRDLGLTPLWSGPKRQELLQGPPNLFRSEAQQHLPVAIVNGDTSVESLNLQHGDDQTHIPAHGRLQGQHIPAKANLPWPPPSASAKDADDGLLGRARTGHCTLGGPRIRDRDKRAYDSTVSLSVSWLLAGARLQEVAWKGWRGAEVCGLNPPRHNFERQRRDGTGEVARNTSVERSRQASTLRTKRVATRAYNRSYCGGRHCKILDSMVHVWVQRTRFVTNESCLYLRQPT